MSIEADNADDEMLNDNGKKEREKKWNKNFTAAIESFLNIKKNKTKKKKKKNYYFFF